MTLHEGWSLIGAVLAGLLLGVLFFGGLWWTVRSMLASARGAGFLLASVLLRGALAIAGFYLVGAGQWPRLLACLVGFLLGRVAVTLWTRRAGPPFPHAEPRHAS